MTNLLKELEAVVRLQADFDNASGWEEEQTRGASEDISAVNFLRTHHTEIAEALRDARRYRWLREAHESESPKYGLWHVRDYQGEPISNLSPSLDFAIDAAMHNSAREVGE